MTRPRDHRIESIAAPEANPIVTRELSDNPRWRTVRAGPTCETHDRRLELVPKRELADHGMKLSSNKELWACPRCLSGGNRVQYADVLEAVIDRWDAHASDFRNRKPPTSYLVGQADKYLQI